MVILLVRLALAAGQSPASVPDGRNQQASEHNRRGVEFSKSGNHAGALREFRAAIELQPGYAEAQYNLGVALVQVGEPEQGLMAFRAAARLRPASAPMRLGLALELLKTSRLEEGIEELRQTVKIDPNFAEAHYNLGIALGQQSDLAGAESACGRNFNRLTAGSA